MIEKLEQYNKKFNKDKPMSILKKKPEESKKPANLPLHKSSAVRAPTSDIETGFGAKKEQLPVEEEQPRLTTEEISLGIEQAKAASDAPSLDLAAFEAALKQKHD